jgi:predicted nucleic acid-binding protein
VIFFADSSALIKLYLAEDGSDHMRAVTDRPFAVSLLAYGEIHAAFARRRRDGLIAATEYEDLRQRFAEDWDQLMQVPVSREALAPIPRLCERYPLRGADALQLASALLLRSRELEVTFACSDRRLLEAADGEGLATFDPGHQP